MMEKSAIIEKKQEIRRISTGILISIACHILLVMFLILSGQLPREKEDEVVVVRVKLADRLHAEVSEKGSPEKEPGPPKKTENQNNQKETPKKNVPENENSNSETSEVEKPENLKEERPEKNDSSQIPVESDNSPVKEPVETDDSIDQYEKEQEAERKRLEDEFYASENDTEEEQQEGPADNQNEKNDSVDDLLSNLDDVDSDSNKSGPSDSSDKGDEGITWTGGRSRKLVGFEDITAPEEMLKSGLKFSITLEFTVLENGLISRVKAVESSGNPVWDEDIVEQFKRWQFESAPGLVSLGRVSFHFGY